MKKIILILLMLSFLTIFTERNFSAKLDATRQACYQCSNSLLFVWFILPDSLAKRNKASIVLDCRVIRAIRSCPDQTKYPEIIIKVLP